MKTAVTVPPDAASVLRARLADYVELTKPGIAVMVLVTVAAGFCLAATGTPDLVLLLHTLVGTGLVAAGASVGTALLVYWLGRRTADAPTAFAAMVIYAFLPFVVVQSSMGFYEPLVGFFATADGRAIHVVLAYDVRQFEDKRKQYNPDRPNPVLLEDGGASLTLIRRATPWPPGGRRCQGPR